MTALTAAMLCLFTVGAGAAVAHLLPARLKLFELPEVGGGGSRVAVSGIGAVAGGQPVRSGGPPTPSGVSARLSGLISSGELGQRVGALVINYSTGQTLYSMAPGTGFTPASTTKLATAVAAIDTLGISARFRTAVRLSPGARPAIVLVGGGDPTLSAGRYPAGSYPRPASLEALARLAVKALRARGIHSVRLTYDNTLFVGPTLAPGWPAAGAAGNYISTGNVSPITGLEVDQGRLTQAGVPQDSDDPSNFSPRSMVPGHDAAVAFAGFLREGGIIVRNIPVQARGRERAVRARAIASVRSVTVAQMVQWMLQESNNVIAETLARQVAIATGKPATFSGAAHAVMAVDARLGVRGIHLHDGSGLSPLDLISPRALVKLIEIASGRGFPGLRPVITGLPVAGFSGTLSRGSDFGPFGRAALGTVRAKTGNLSSVATMAGIAYATDGDVLIFAFMGNDIGRKLGLQPESLLSRLATELAGCGCR
ncbi:MAG TPA: D-alanyl-D-alanine carboxypeptidase [Streptosporangiaceae bacterium]|nr:D-alanyl-D-alanine carboxypeptidase [Streptosporangiaceae bacterium]